MFVIFSSAIGLTLNGVDVAQGEENNPGKIFARAEVTVGAGAARVAINVGAEMAVEFGSDAGVEEGDAHAEKIDSAIAPRKIIRMLTSRLMHDDKKIWSTVHRRSSCT